MYRGLQTKQRCKWSANYQLASRSTPFKYRGKMSFNSIEFISLQNVQVFSRETEIILPKEVFK